MTSFSVRPARSSDLAKLTDFVISMALESESIHLDAETVLAGIKSTLTEEATPHHAFSGVYWVIEETTQSLLVGAAFLTIEWSDWYNRAYGWMQSVYIMPEYRGQGLLGLLIQTIEKQSVINGKPLLELRLYVDEQNHRAISSYVKEGFALSQYLVMHKPLN